jgi:TP901 family phage tail tape measure protein
MVGFTIPLSVFGTTAAKTFMELEEQTIKFRRVYGDLMTASGETDEMIEQIKTLAEEYTKYGVAVADTMQLASQAAAMGKQGAELTAQVSEATRLSVLGNVSQEQALETSISLTNAFGIATTQLASKIDFLNAVENQTVTSIEDLTIAVPKAGPVIQQLGGDVEDLAFFLTAMKEGGINASEGANALKSGLASLINPTSKASEMLGIYGINIREIVSKNAGNVSGIVVDFAKALDQLNPTDRARAIEQLFGKFQFARLSTLFQNVIQDGSQAARVLDLMQASTADLAALSNKELRAVEESTTYKFKAAIEEFKAALAPIGEEFMKLVTPLIEFGTSVLKVFNNMGDTAKGFITGTIAVLGGLAPVALMTFGLVANGAANLIKAFQFLRNIFMGVGNQSNVLGEQLQYMTEEQLRSEAIAASLEQTHARLPQIFTSEASALESLREAYERANTAAAKFQGRAMPTTIGGAQGKVVKAAKGGFIVGPGTGTSDSIAAMVSNGEAIIPADRAKQYASLIEGIISGNIPGFFKGTNGVNVEGRSFSTNSRRSSDAIQREVDALEKPVAEIIALLDKLESQGTMTATALRAMPEFRAMRGTPEGPETQRGHLTNRREEGGLAYYSGLTREMLKTQNQGTKGDGQLIQEFLSDWSAVKDGLLAAGEVGLRRTGAIGSRDNATQEQISVLQELDSEIGKLSAEIAKDRGSDKVTEQDIANAASIVIDRTAKQGGTRGQVGAALQERRDTETAKRQIIDSKKLATDIQAGDVDLKAGTVTLVDKSGNTVGRVADEVRNRANAAATPGDRRSILAGAAFRSSTEPISGTSPYTAYNKKGSISPDYLGQVIGKSLDISSKSASPSKETIKATDNMVDGVTSAIRASEPEVQKAMEQTVSSAARKSSRASREGGPVGSGSQTFVKDEKSGNVVSSEKAAQINAGRQAGLTRYVDGTMNSMARLSNTVIALSGAMSSATFLASAFGIELGQMGQTVFEITNLMLTLAIATRGLIAAEKTRAVVTAATESANLISAGGGRAGFFRNLAKGGATGKFAGAKNVVGNLGGLAKDTLAPLGKFGALLTRVGTAFFRFLPIIGPFIAAFAIGKAVFDQTKKDIQGLGETANLSSEKMGKAAELLNFTAKEISFKGSFAGTAAGSNLEQQSEIEALRANDEFKNNFSTQIGAIKGASKEQAELALKSLSIQMAASGAPKEAVDTMVKALSAEAGRTDLDLTFTKIDFSTKEGLAQATIVAQDAAKLFNQSFETNYNPGAWFGIQNKEMSTASETVSAQFTSLFQGLKAGFDSGALTAEEFNTQLAAISGQLSSMSGSQLSMILPGIIEGLDMKEEVKGITNVYDQLLLVKAAAAGVVIDPTDMEAFVAASKEDATPEQLQEANRIRRKYNNTIKETTVAQQQANAEAQMINEQQEAINSAKGSLDEQLDTLRAQISTHKTLIDMGYSEAEASQIASNAMWATALAAAQAEDAINKNNVQFTALLEQMKLAQNLQGKVEKFSGGNGGGEKSDYEKAIESLKEQQTEAANTTRAYSRLSKSGMSASAAFAAAKDPITAAAVATTKVGTAAWTKLVKLIKDANRAAAGQELKDLLNQTKIDNSLTKNFTAIVPLLSKIGLSSEQINDVFSNPVIAQKFIDDLKDGKINSKDIYNYLTALKSGVDIKLNFNKATPEGLREEFDKIYDNAMEQFDVQERQVDQKYAGKIDTATKAVETAEKAVDAAQKKIDTLQTTVEKKQREIEISIDRPIEEINKSISAIEREIETQFNRPIADLQEESSDLSNDLTLIDKQAEAINKKYDDQQKSLEEAANASKEILEQDKSRLNVATAIASGNAAEVARAMQESRAREAEAAKERADQALEAARAKALGKLRSANGLSREQIEARQFEISQKIFQLEESKEVKAKAVLVLQDQAYALEQKRQPLLDSIRIIEDQIYNLQVGELLTAQNNLKTRQDELQAIEDEKNKEIEAINLKKKAWDDAKLAADAAKVEANNYVGKLETALSLVEQIKKAWNNFGSVTVPDMAGPIKEDKIVTPKTNGTGGTGGAKGDSAALKADKAKSTSLQKQIDELIFRNADVKTKLAAAEYVFNKVNSSQAQKNKVTGYKYELGQIGQSISMLKSQKTKLDAKIKAGGYAMGGMIPSYMANGGMASIFKNMGTDTVPAMLTPGEFVVRKSAVQSFGADNLKAVNSGTYNGESVYNYSVNVNVQTDANADQIAKQVMTQIKRIDSQRIRGNRFNG